MERKVKEKSEDDADKTIRCFRPFWSESFGALRSQEEASHG